MRNIYGSPECQEFGHRPEPRQHRAFRLDYHRHTPRRGLTITDEKRDETKAATPSQMFTRTIVGFDAPTDANPMEVQFGSPEARYRIDGFVGEGGMGEVFSGEDSLIKRPVAVKYLRSGHISNPAAVQQFWTEVLHAGLLDHPCVPPVHDVGIDKQGRPFYVMRLIRGRSLREILVASDPTSSELADAEWGLPRFLSSFVQVCGAVQFAHDSEILHLDIKPENIMIGEYGDVYLVDWGLSEPSTPSVKRGTRGTPAYMAPEQTKPNQPVSGVTDVFALGALLYELCTRRRAFSAETTSQTFELIRSGDYERGEAWERCPASLRDTIAQALDPNPTRRMASAKAMAAQVRDFLDGRRDRLRRLERARTDLRSAHEELDRARQSLELARTTKSSLDSSRPEAWASAEEKAAFWDQEDAYDQALEASELHRERALQHLLRALEDAPGNADVRQALAEIYLERLEHAEQLGDQFQRRFLETQLRALKLPDVDRILAGNGTLSISCEASSVVECSYSQLVERRRVLTATNPVVIASDHLQNIPISPGRYQLDATAAGRRSLIAPIRVDRCADVEMTLRLRTETEIGADFIQIPAGPFIMGGDDKTFKSHPRTLVQVEEFALARFPVTWEEYREFLQSIVDNQYDPAEAWMPHIPTKKEPVWDVHDGVVVYSEERRNWPIFCVTFDQAVGYCDWRSNRDGRRYRLPTDAEWEKAARGVDERIFPWGDRFDATFCKNADSTEGKSQPEDVGAYPVDESPYGVRDMAGGIREWCDSWFSEKDSFRLVRGGSWNFSSVGAHCAYRLGCAPNIAYPFIGFRLAHDFG